MRRLFFWTAGSLLALLTACGDDTATGGAPEGGGPEGGGGSTSDGGGGSTSDGGGGSTSDGGGGAANVCGDGNAVDPEECDGTDLAGETCQSQGFDGGGLGCDNNCELDTADCTNNEDCSDGVDNDEDGSTDCADSDCALDPVCLCGNDAIDGAEDCDNANLNGESCATASGGTLQAGTLACDATCSFDLTGCFAIVCNNDGVVDVANGEQCDDGNVADDDGCDSGCTFSLDWEIEPNDDELTANDFYALEADGDDTLKGYVGVAGDVDYFLVTIGAGTTADIVAETFDGPLGSLCADNEVDSLISIFDDQGALLDSDDDAGAGFCSLASAGALPEGDYFVALQSSTFAPDATFDYSLQISVTSIVCGDGMLGSSEGCDDGNVAAGDGCDDLCQPEADFFCSGEPSVCIAIMPETEPNDDTIPNTNGGNGNDFANGFCEDTTTACNVGNAAQNCGGIGGGTCTAHNDASLVIAEGPFNTSGGTLLFSAALSPAGDEDTYGIFNDGVNPVVLTAETFGPVFGACPGIDTEINIRNAAGTELANDDEGGIASCSLESFVIVPGETLFVHVIDFLDNTAVPAYLLQVSFDEIVCGDGSVEPGELCDDGNTTDGDGCSSTCSIEGVVSEIEPNDTAAGADASGIVIDASTTIIGAITDVTDELDFFRVEIATPTVVRFETFTGINDCAVGTTTTLRLFQSDGTTQISTDNVSGIRSCSGLVVALQPGVYYIRVEETGTNANVPAYLLEASFQTDTGVESETAGTSGANDTSATADGNLDGFSEVFVLGDHTLAGAGITDRDFFAITVPAGAGVRIETLEGDLDVNKTCESNNLDSEITLFASDGTTVLVNDDDDGRGFCSLIDGTSSAPLDANAFNNTASPVTWFIEVRESDAAGTGDDIFNYRLQVTIR